MYLLDSNILIYLLSEEGKVGKFLNALGEKHFAITTVSRLEVLIGSEKQGLSLIDAENYLDNFENIILDKEIVKEAVNFASKAKNKLKFKDLVIAATAVSRKKTLITADGDFLKLPGLKVKFLKIG